MITELMKPVPGCLLISCTFAGSLIADDWDPNDDTFDPQVKSVVIGDRSWIGDPSPFVQAGLSRTGYTYVNATDSNIACSTFVDEIRIPAIHFRGQRTGPGRRPAKRRGFQTGTGSRSGDHSFTSVQRPVYRLAQYRSPGR